jgi:hypothetical protein
MQASKFILSINGNRQEVAMKKHLRFAVFILLTGMIAACASPAISEPSESSPNQVETIVAATLQAIAPQITDVPAVESQSPSDLLPHSLYFLGKDEGWITQVYRLERDGKAKSQLTFEEFNITDYDVSVVDGSVAYVASNQLLLANADGSNRRILVDGGSGPDLRGFYSPVFSPDGRTLAYAHGGLYFYDLASGVPSLIIEDQLEEPQILNGVEQRLPIETYSPKRFFSDGSKLLVTLGYFEGTSAAIFDPTTRDLVRIQDKDGNPLSYYGLIDWSLGSNDGSNIYAAVTVPQFMYRSGDIWWADMATGQVTIHIPADPESGTMRLPHEPYLAPDGQLYYFYGEYGVDSGFVEPPVLELVRSAADGVTNRTVLRPENFRLMSEALWAPDASFALVSTLPERRWNDAEGVLELYYTDGQKEAIWLAPSAQQMKWGP